MTTYPASAKTSYTLEEATSKTCPMSLATGRSSKCVGSMCMAWKWKNSKVGHDLSHWRETYSCGRKRTENEAIKEWEAFHRGEPLLGRCGMAAGN